MGTQTGTPRQEQKTIIATQKFRCVYCGTRYDLLKRPTHQRLKEPSA